MSGEFHPLRVIDTRSEIGGMAKTVMLEVPTSLADVFRWRAGQHLSFRFDFDGEEVRRSYSISSSPVSGEPLRITVKRVEDGLVSNHINDTIKTGDVLQVMPPFGGFCLDAGEAQRRTHYFFGAGSGVTPLYAMIRTVLAAEPWSVCHFVYGNRDEKSILLSDELANQVAEHPDRLSLHHVLSGQSMWSGFKAWRQGKVDQEVVKALIDERPPYAQDAQYYVCGPGTMNATVRAALMALDVPADRIHMESYGGAVDADLTVEGIAATAHIHLGGDVVPVEIGADQTLLEAARSAGLKPPFSCQSGVCGACRATLRKGTVHMRARMALEDHDIERMVVLTCQSVATSPELEIAYE